MILNVGFFVQKYILNGETRWLSQTHTQPNLYMCACVSIDRQLCWRKVSALYIWNGVERRNDITVEKPLNPLYHIDSNS